MRLFTLLLLAVSSAAMAQRNTLFNLEDRLFQNDAPNQSYNINGYNIKIDEYSKSFSPQTIQELKAKYFVQ